MMGVCVSVLNSCLLGNGLLGLGLAAVCECGKGWDVLLSSRVALEVTL